MTGRKAGSDLVTIFHMMKSSTRLYSCLSKFPTAMISGQGWSGKRCFSKSGMWRAARNDLDIALDWAAELAIGQI